MFVTATIIDFVLVFAEPTNADVMTASLLDDLRYYEAELWAFVVNEPVTTFQSPIENRQSSNREFYGPPFD